MLLWADYTHRSNVCALDMLLAYNTEDVINLEALMVIAYNQRVEQTPFAARLKLDTPAPPDVPFSADSETLAGLRWR